MVISTARSACGAWLLPGEVDGEPLGPGEPVSVLLAEVLGDGEGLTDGEVVGEVLGVPVGLALGEVLGDCAPGLQLGE